MGNNFSQEERISLAELVESLQAHFYERVGKVDWNSAKAFAEFTGFTLWPEEIKELIKQVPAGRAGVAMILEAMNVTAAHLRKNKRERVKHSDGLEFKQIFLSEQEIVECFKQNVLHSARQAQHRAERKGKYEYATT